MSAGRGHLYLLVIGFLIVIGVVGPIQAVIELREGETPQALDLFRQAPAPAALRAFEHELEDRSVVARTLRPWTQFPRFVLLRDTGEQALVGRQDWWFYRPDVRYLIERCPDDPAHRTGCEAAVSAIVAFHDQLAKRGIPLLVVPVPGKPSVYPEMLTRRAVVGDRRVSLRTRGLLDDLAKAGVETVDLSAAFQRARTDPNVAESEAWYLARDTHWTNQGARLAAKTIAERIRTLGWDPVGTVDYDLRPMSVKRSGDILRMLKCEQIEGLFEPEVVACQQVVRRDNGELYRDDPTAGVLVLGDSFLRIYERDEPGSAGMVAHLASELRQPLASVISDGGASTLVRQELARKPHLLNGKRLVVWEFVERDVRFGMEGWQEVPLPQATADPPGVTLLSGSGH